MIVTWRNITLLKRNMFWFIATRCDKDFVIYLTGLYFSEINGIVIRQNCGDVMSVKYLCAFFSPPILYRLTYRSKGVPFARNAKYTRLTKWRSTRRVRRDMPRRAEDVMTANSKVLAVKLSPSSERRQKRQRKLYWEWNVPSASTENKFRWKDASTLNWVVTRRGRVKWFSSKLSTQRFQRILYLIRNK